MCLKNNWQPWLVEANAMGTGCEGLVPRVRTGTIELDNRGELSQIWGGGG